MPRRHPHTDSETGQLELEGLTDPELDLSKVETSLDELFLLTRQYRDSAKFKQLIHFVGGFPRYSAFNAMLVHIQMPDARYVLPAKRWMKEYKRVPTRDAQPLVMLQPMSPVMFGFDVSQTEGKELPHGFGDSFRPVGEIGQKDFERTLENCKRDGIDVRTRSLVSTLGGYVRNAGSADHVIGIGRVERGKRSLDVNGTKISVIAEVVLNENLSRETNYTTLTHELGHLYCGHVGTPNPNWWPDRRNLDKNTREFEAESVSYLVCQRAGLETPAAQYLNGYLDANSEVPKVSLHAIFRSAQRIEMMREKILAIRKPEKSDPESSAEGAQ